MKWLALVLLLTSCKLQIHTKGANEAQAQESSHEESVPKGQQKYEVTVCTDKLEVSVADIGACDREGMCGVIVSAPAGFMYCVRKYPVKGQRLTFCRKTEDKVLDGYEYERFQQNEMNIDDYNSCRQDQ